MRIGPFEKHYEKYEKWFEKHRCAHLSELEAVKRLIPEGEGIEVGMGSGRFAEPLGIKLGVEPSSRMANIARKRGIEAVECLAEDLPFENESFDFVLMVTTICFLDDVEKAFKEAHRVLKHGGSIIIGFIDKESPLGIEYLKHKEENVFYREATFYSVNEVISFLKSFRIASVLQTIFKPLNKIDSIEPVVDGYGKGSFVAIKAVKEG
jgi:ubiquinone/menaquinone biosynthesis C-methylase UbiE